MLSPGLLLFVTVVACSLQSLTALACDTDKAGYFCKFQDTCGKGAKPASKRHHHSTGYLSHGTQVNDASQWPFMAQIISFKDECQGVILSDQHIGTHEDCLRSPTYGSFAPQISVIVGLVQSTSSLESKEFKQHEVESVCQDGYSDYAILKLKEKLQFSSTVQPICWPTQGVSNMNIYKETNANCYHLSWGSTAPDADKLSRAQFLQQRRVAASKADVDRNIKSKDIVFYNMGSSKSNTCAGDEGAPVVCENNGVWYLAGNTQGLTEGCSVQDYSTVARIPDAAELTNPGQTCAPTSVASYQRGQNRRRGHGYEGYQSRDTSDADEALEKLLGKLYKKRKSIDKMIAEINDRIDDD